MTNIEIIERLEKRLDLLYKKGTHGDTGYIWSETIKICKDCVSLINAYEIAAQNQQEVREKAIGLLQKAILEADKYAQPKNGYDTKNFINPSFSIHNFLNPAKDGIEEFTYYIEGKNP